MRTIVISSFHTLVSRNIFATPFFDALKKREDIQIVLVVPDFKIEYFRRYYGGARVIIYGISQYLPSKYFWGLFFKRLGSWIYNNETNRMKQEYKYYWDRKIRVYFFERLIGFIGDSFMARAIIRWFDLHLSPKNLFGEVFDRYNPDLVFSTDIQNENDVSLAQDARRRGVPVFGMIRSWDNTTMRILRIWPDRLILGSQEVCDEAVAYYGFPKEKVIITGNPYYDAYVRPSSRSRVEFCAELGLDPKKKIIFYAPAGSLLLKSNDLDQHVMETLGKIADASILVRFPLGGDVPLTNFTHPLQMIFDVPGEHFGNGKEKELRPEDDARLIEELRFSDVIVSGPTSILLDAMFFDKPTVGADFYPTARHPFAKCWGFLSQHIKKLFRTGGVYHAKTERDFLCIIERYLENPRRDAEGRARARKMWFSFADGKSSERLARVIMDGLGLVVSDSHA